MGQFMTNDQAIRSIFLQLSRQNCFTTNIASDVDCDPCEDICAAKCSSVFGEELNETSGECMEGCGRICRNYDGNTQNCEIEATENCNGSGSPPTCFEPSCSPDTSCYTAFMIGCQVIPEPIKSDWSQCNASCNQKCKGLGYFTDSIGAAGMGGTSPGNHLMIDNDGNVIFDTNQYSMACLSACHDKCWWHGKGPTMKDDPDLIEYDELDCTLAKTFHFPQYCQFDDYPAEQQELCLEAAMTGCEDNACYDTVTSQDMMHANYMLDHGCILLPASAGITREQCTRRQVLECEMANCYADNVGATEIQSICQPCIAECNQKCSALYGDAQTECQTGCMTSCETYGRVDGTACVIEAKELCGYEGTIPECQFAACDPPTTCYESFMLGCQINPEPVSDIGPVCENSCNQKCSVMFDGSVPVNDDGTQADFEWQECYNGCYANCHDNQGAGDCELMASILDLFNHCQDEAFCKAAYIRGCEDNPCLDQASPEHLTAFLEANLHITSDPIYDMFIRRGLLAQCEKQKCYTQVGATPDQCDACFSTCHTKCQSVYGQSDFTQNCFDGCYSSCSRYAGSEHNCLVEADSHCPSNDGVLNTDCFSPDCGPVETCFAAFMAGCVEIPAVAQTTVAPSLDGLCRDTCNLKCVDDTGIEDNTECLDVCFQTCLNLPIEKRVSPCDDPLHFECPHFAECVDSIYSENGYDCKCIIGHYMSGGVCKPVMPFPTKCNERFLQQKLKKLKVKNLKTPTFWSSKVSCQPTHFYLTMTF